jgi:hypothetical protein
MTFQVDAPATADVDKTADVASRVKWRWPGTRLGCEPCRRAQLEREDAADERKKHVP